MADESKGLNDRQRTVVTTMRMRFNEAKAMAYLKAEGHPMSLATWYALTPFKAWLKRTQLQRLHHIAAIGFEDQHAIRIETCELIEEQMWENYRLEKSPFKKVMILKAIQELQPLISTYYDTRMVLEKTRGTGREQFEQRERRREE